MGCPLGDPTPARHPARSRRRPQARGGDTG
jgi:hypothetical protein